jgi:hypothetical protein
LLTDASPRNHRLALGGVAPPVEEEHVVLKLGLPLRLLQEPERDGNVMAEDFAEDAVAQLEPKDELVQGKQLLSPALALDVHRTWQP